jgi:hypothetical protein
MDQEERCTIIDSLPKQTELNILIELLNKQKYIDFDILTYKTFFSIEDISQIFDEIQYEDNYLFHRLLMKCNKIYIYPQMNQKLMNLLNEKQHYIFNE